MKRYHRVLCTLSRFLIGSSLLLLGLLKVADVDSTVETIRAVLITSASFSITLAVMLIVFEIISGILVLCNILTRFVLLANIFMLLLYSIVALALITADREVNCNCFGSLSASKFDAWLVARNGIGVTVLFLAFRLLNRRSVESRL
jgi:uncharacterized membrane protein YphA (DoxX/SURF4 family)